MSYRIPNYIFDRMTEFTDDELKCIVVVAARAPEPAVIPDILRTTGLPARRVSVAMQGLVARGWVVCGEIMFWLSEVQP